MLAIKSFYSPKLVTLATPLLFHSYSPLIIFHHFLGTIWALSPGNTEKVLKVIKDKNKQQCLLFI
jgi:hypothetical protein